MGALWCYSVVDSGALYGHSDVAGVDRHGAWPAIRLAGASALASMGARACREYGSGVD